MVGNVIEFEKNDSIKRGKVVDKLKVYYQYLGTTIDCYMVSELPNGKAWLIEPSIITKIL